jgi:hypothetical protein
MSALPPKADIAERDLDVRFVPKADTPSRRELLRPGFQSWPICMEASRRQWECVPRIRLLREPTTRQQLPALFVLIADRLRKAGLPDFASGRNAM